MHFLALSPTLSLAFVLAFYLTFYLAFFLTFHLFYVVIWQSIWLAIESFYRDVELGTEFWSSKQGPGVPKETVRLLRPELHRKQSITEEGRGGGGVI